MKTDTQLRQDICAELTWDPAVNASEIGVAVKDGIVTLTGHVDSYTEKWHAENISVEVNGDDITLSGMVHTWGERDLARHTAWGTPGVRNVFDNMTIAH